MLSFIVRRPRPRTYDPSISIAERKDPNEAFSFPSGHVAGSFAMATAYSRLFMMRHPNSPLIAPLWIGTYSLASATGVFRTLSGDHFWTDVIIGAVSGIGFGLLVPWMHTPTVASTPAKPSALRVRVAPVAFARGAGGMLVVE